MSAILTRASNQWMSRANDERFLSLEDLAAAVNARRDRSQEVVRRLQDVPVGYTAEGDLYLGRPERYAAFTNYSFGKLAQEVGAPAGYLRSLPAPLVAMNLAWGLEHSEQRETKILVSAPSGDDPGEVRTFTSPSYGRIWDGQVVKAIQNVNQAGNWVIPAASYASRDPLRATTLYASDHDVFVFLVDPERPVEVGSDTLFRGFMAWNSEVGARSFGLCTFLYRTVCDNRIVWGATEVNQLIIRHTAGGPDRFAEQAAPALLAYSEGSTRGIEVAIKEAQDKTVGKDVASVEAWLREKGFTREVAKVSVALAEQEEGDPTSLWNVVQGVSAYARSIEHSDTRVDLEKAAGRLLAEVGSEP